MTGGRVVRGDVDSALAAADVIVEGEFETGFVEHACIEPEAGFARRVGNTIEIQACTQSPYMDRADIAKLLGISPEACELSPRPSVGASGRSLIYRCSHFLPLRHGRRDERCAWSIRVSNR